MTDVPAVDIDYSVFTPEAKTPAGPSEQPCGRLRRRQLADVRSRSVQWLVPGLVPLRTLTLFAGIGGLGKSTLLASIAAGVSTGEYGDPADVLVLSYEDTAEEIWRPRVLAAEGDLTRIHEVYVELDQGGVVVLPTHLDELADEIRATQAKAVIVDPIVAAIDLDLDAHKDQHVRGVLGRLVALAEDTGSAVLGVGHLNKSPSKDAYIRIANSTAFWNAARSVVLVTEDEDEDQRLVSQVKTNWARRRPTQRWAMRQVVLPDEIDPETGQPITTCRLEFVEDVDDFDISEVLGDRKRDSGGAGATVRAEDFLAECLADGGWHDSAGLKKLAASAAISERTLKRAAQELDVEHDRRGYPGVTWWRLPQSGQVFSLNVGPTEGVAQPCAFEAGSQSSRAKRYGEETTGPSGPTDDDLVVGIA